MTIEIVYHAPAQRWVRADHLNSQNVQSTAMQTDQSENQNSVGVGCSIGEFFKLYLGYIWEIYNQDIT